MNLKELLFKKGAPVLATLLGGPLAGNATKMIIDEMGLKEDATDDQIMTALEKDPQALASVRIAEVKAGTAAGEASVANTQGARDMHIKMKDSTTTILSYLIFFGFFGMCYTILFVELPTKNQELLYLIVGYIAGDFKTVMNFWFGSSKGSRNKDLQPTPSGGGLIEKMINKFKKR